MAKKKCWTDFELTKVKLNAEQAVLSCCDNVGRSSTGGGVQCDTMVFCGDRIISTQSSQLIYVFCGIDKTMPVIISENMKIMSQKIRWQDCEVIRVRLNPEQAVLSCCDSVSRGHRVLGNLCADDACAAGPPTTTAS